MYAEVLMGSASEDKLKYYTLKQNSFYTEVWWPESALKQVNSDSE